MRNKKTSAPVTPDGLSYRTYNNKVVECTIHGEDSAFTAQNLIEKMTSDSNFLQVIPMTALLGMTYFGRAFCNEGDEFNEEEGKRLARERALGLFHDDFDKVIVSFLEDLHMIEARLFNYLRKHDKLSVYLDAKDVDELYDTRIRMPDQPDYFSYMMKAIAPWKQELLEAEQNEVKE